MHKIWLDQVHAVRIANKAQYLLLGQLLSERPNVGTSQAGARNWLSQIGPTEKSTGWAKLI